MRAAIASSASCNAYTGRFDESLEALAEGEQRNPQFADLLNDFADALVHACEPAAALEKITHAIELNPLCPDQYWWAAAGANYQLSRYAEARNSLAAHARPDACIQVNGSFLRHAG